MSFDFNAILRDVLNSPKWRDMGGLGEDTIYGELALDVAKAATAAKWQPIETAPRDGSDVLLWDHTVWVGYWFDNPKNPALSCWWNGDTIVDHPTHWMPLPPPPEEGK